MFLFLKNKQMHVHLLLQSFSSLGPRQICELMFYSNASGHPPGQTDSQQTWPGSGQSQPLIQ